MSKHILVIRYSSLGDIVLTSATVINLKIAYPDSRIVFLTKEIYGDLARMIPGVDEVALLDSSGHMFEFIKLLHRLDSYNFDLIVDLHSNFRSAIARKLISAPTKVSYDGQRKYRTRLVRTNKIPQNYDHTIDRYNKTLSELGESIHCRRPQITVPELSEELSGMLENNEQRPVVVIAPGASHETKRYDLDKFITVANELGQAKKPLFFWVLSSSDRELIAEHEDKLQGNILFGLPLPQLAALLAKADLTISNDSGVAHLSSGVGTDVISIFGPTHPALGFSPRSQFDKVIEVNEPCRPCSLHGKSECHREERFCFNKIKTEDILSLAIETLSRNNARSKAVLVDRDGTIIEDKHYLSDPDGVELISGAANALKKLNKSGYKIVIVSNQSGIGRGYFSVEQAETVNRKMLQLLTESGVEISGVYFCPHYPGEETNEYSQDCNCRKPSPLMAEEAARQLGLDLRNSFVIGDKVDDFYLGRVIGAQPLMVQTGKGREHSEKLTARDRNLLFDDIAGAVDYILTGQSEVEN